MKIYFVGSISGKEQYKESYEAVVESIRRMGHEVFEITLEPSQDYVYEKMSDDDKVDQYKRVLDWIRRADVVVAEASHPSIGVGYEISLALEKEKPVVVLYCEGKAPHFLEGLKSDKLVIEKYDVDTVKGILEDALEYANDQSDTRFNFFISPRIGNYLNWIAKYKRTPRAVYLRKLIEADMKKRDEEK